MGNYSAIIYDISVHSNFWKPGKINNNGQYQSGRFSYSKFFILHVWKYMLGVFFRMFKFLWKYIYWKRWYTGKGIFSTIGYANISYFSQLINFIIQFTMLIIFIAYFIIAGTTDLKITVNIIMLPILVLQMGLLGMGFGIIVSALTTKYRDLVMLVGFAVSLWQYATPVAYGLCLIPEEWMGLYKLNPMTMIVTTFRYSLLGSGSMDWAYYGISWLVTVIVLAIGVLLFTRVEKTFMDTI